MCSSAKQFFKVFKNFKYIKLEAGSLYFKSSPLLGILQFHDPVIYLAQRPKCKPDLSENGEVGGAILYKADIEDLGLSGTALSICLIVGTFK